jgi:O-antigen ligase
MIIIYVLLNIAIMVIYPKGIFPMYGIHFLGIRTRFTEYSIALIYIALLYYNNFSNKDKKAKKIMWCSIIIAAVNILIQWIATGIIVVILIFIIYGCIKKIKNIDLVYIFGFALLIIMTINLVNGNLLNIFGGIFELLNKDITLTGRTLIWSNAIKIVKKYFWIGYGYVNDGNIIPYSSGLWQAHNTILQSMCESGIIGTVTFFYIIFKQGYPSIKKYNKKVNALNVSVVFGFLIMMMSEILYYYPIFMFMLFLIGNSKNEMRSENDKE